MSGREMAVAAFAATLARCVPPTTPEGRAARDHEVAYLKGSVTGT